MKKFDELMEIAAILNGPDGCSWDRKQTFQSLQPYVLEEAHEVLEAVDSDEDAKMIEELGDLFYTVIFYAKVAQKLGRFTMEDIIECEKEKLIRRHPHVFANERIESDEELEKNWERIKKQEKGKEHRAHAFDSLPPSMPLVAKAQKMLRIMLKSSCSLFADRMKSTCAEQEIGQELLHLIWLAEINGIDAEGALRRALTHTKEHFMSQGG
jgi:tetrapyrrole methylase family protein/MazG family protein